MLHSCSAMLSSAMSGARLWRAGCFLVFAALVGLLSTSCEELDPSEAHGEVVLALQGDMSFPEDLDQLYVVATIDGAPAVERTYDVAPTGKTKLPATLRVGLGYPAGAELSVRLVGISDGEARVVANAETTIPEDDAVLLHLPLQWLCRQEASGEEPTEATGLCDEGFTCSAGACVSSRVLVSRLKTFVEEDVFGGAPLGDPGGSCFATAECLDEGVNVMPDSQCRVELELPQDAQANFGLIMAPGQGGIAGEEGRYVPLDRSASGWELLDGPDEGEAGTLRAQLPTAVCDELDAGTVSAVRATAACPTKAPALPTCGPWSVIDGAVLVTVLQALPETDASAPVVDVADASAADAGGGSPQPTLEITLASGEPLGPLGLGVTVALEVEGIDPESALWSSDNEAVATVSADGVITTHALGSATIRVDFMGEFGELRIIVANSGLGTSIRGKLVSLAIDVEQTEFAAADIGELVTLVAVGTYENGEERDLTDEADWTSSDGAVAAIDAPGTLLLTGAGETDVAAAVGEVTDSVTLWVQAAPLVPDDAGAPPEPAPVELALAPAPDPLWVGQSFQPQATLLFDDSTSSSPNGVSYASDDPTVVSVATDGTVLAVALGSTTLRASYGELEANVPVTVSAPSLEELSIAAIEPIPEGYTEQLVATALFADGNTLDITASATWSSSAPDVADVDATGLLTAVSAGTVVITAGAPDGPLTATLEVVVTDAQTTALTIDAPAPVPAGRTVALVARATLSTGATRVVSPQASWTSANTAVVTVGAGGTAAAQGVGIAEVSAAFDGFVATTSFETVAAVPTTLQVAPQTVTLFVGEATAFAATLTYSDGATEDVSASAAWSVANGAIAQLGNTGVATALFAGTTTVTATAQGQTATATLRVQNDPDVGGESDAGSPPGLVIMQVQVEGDPTETFLAAGQFDRFLLVLLDPADGPWGSQNPIDTTTTEAATWQITGGEYLGTEGAAMFRSLETEVTVTATFEGQEYSAAVPIDPATSLWLARPGDNNRLVELPPASTVAQGDGFDVRVFARHELTSDVELTYFDPLQWTFAGDIQVADGFSGRVSFPVPGEASITAALGQLSTTSLLTVTPVVTSLDVIADGDGLLEFLPQPRVGDEISLSTLALIGIDPEVATAEDYQDVTAATQWQAFGATLTEQSGDPPLLLFDAPGPVTVTAVYGGAVRTYTLDVLPALPAPESIRLEPSQLTLTPGSYGLMAAYLVYDDGSEVDITAASQTSWEEEFPLGDDGPGLITANVEASPGDYDVTVTWSDGLLEVSEIATVTVVEPAVTLTIVPSEPGVPLEVNDSTLWALELQVGNEVANIDPWDAEWSYDTAGLLVDDGEVFGRAVGTYTVTAFYQNRQATMTIEVVPGWRFVPDISVLMEGMSQYFAVEVFLTENQPIRLETFEAQSEGTVEYLYFDGDLVNALGVGSGSLTVSATIGQQSYTHTELIEVQAAND